MDGVRAIAEAQLTADILERARVFYTQPTGPYTIGDLWVNNGVIYQANASRDLGFDADEWDYVEFTSLGYNKIKARYNEFNIPLIPDSPTSRRYGNAYKWGWDGVTGSTDSWTGGTGSVLSIDSVGLKIVYDGSSTEASLYRTIANIATNNADCFYIHLISANAIQNVKFKLGTDPKQTCTRAKSIGNGYYEAIYEARITYHSGDFYLYINDGFAAANEVQIVNMYIGALGAYNTMPQDTSGHSNPMTTLYGATPGVGTEDNMLWFNGYGIGYRDDDAVWGPTLYTSSAYFFGAKFEMTTFIAGRTLVYFVYFSLGYYIGVDTATGRLHAYLYDGTAYNLYGPEGVSVKDGVLHSALLSFTARSGGSRTATLWLDGVAVDSVSITGSTISTCNIGIGGHGGSTDSWFLGNVGDAIFGLGTISNAEALSYHLGLLPARQYGLTDVRLAEIGSDNLVTVYEKSEVLSRWSAIYDESNATTTLPATLGDMEDGEYKTLASAADSLSLWTPSTSGSAAYDYYQAAEALRAYLFDDPGVILPTTWNTTIPITKGTWNTLWATYRSAADAFWAKIAERSHAPSSDGLVASWDAGELVLDSTLTGLTDRSDGEYALGLSGVTAVTVEGAGSMLDFDGAASFGMFFLRDVTTKMSLCLVIQPDSLAAKTVIYETSTNYGAADGCWALETYGAANKLRFIIRTASLQYLAGQLILPDTSKHTLVITLDMTDATTAALQMYLDNVQQVLTYEYSDTTRPNVYCGKHYVGSRVGTSMFYNGKIGRMHIYNRILGAGERLGYHLGIDPAPTFDLSKVALPSGLLGAWMYDGIADHPGVLVDNTGLGHHALNIAAPTPTTGPFDDEALGYDSSEYSLIDSGLTYLNATEFGIECWAKRTAKGANTEVLYSDYAAANKNILFGYPSSYANAFLAYAGSGATSVTIVSPNNAAMGYEDGVWAHWLMSFKGSTWLRLYKNGVLVAELTSGVPASIAAAHNSLRIGRYTTSFNGSICRMKMYNYAPIGAEALRASRERGILQTYNSGKFIEDILNSSLSLAGYWSFDDDDASAAVDGSGNSRNLTYHGSSRVAGVGAGYARLFNGSSEWANGLFVEAGKVIMEGWYKGTDAGGDGSSSTTAHCLCRIASGDTYVKYRLAIETGGAVTFRWRLVGVTSTSVITGARVINDDAWHHIIAIHTGTVAILIVDGYVEGINTGTTIHADAATQIYFMRSSPSYSVYTSGAIDEWFASTDTYTIERALKQFFCKSLDRPYSYAQWLVDPLNTGNNIVTYTPKYLGSLTEDPVAGMHEGDFYLHNDVSPRVIRRYNSGAWADVSGSDPDYGKYVSAALPDLSALDLVAGDAGISFFTNLVAKNIFSQVITLLTGGQIKSSAFETGESGFSLNDDGTAEFQDVTVRGEFTGIVSASQLVITGITAGTNIMYTDDAEYNSSLEVYTKVVEKIVPASGTVRVYFEGKDGGIDPHGYGKIYIDGVATGTEREFAETYGGWNEDIEVEEDEKVQIYVNNGTSDSTAYITNFTIKIAEEPGILKYL